MRFRVSLGFCLFLIFLRKSFGKKLEVRILGANVTREDEHFCMVMKADFEDAYITSIKHDLSLNIHHTGLLYAQYSKPWEVQPLNVPFRCGAEDGNWDAFLYGTTGNAEVNKDKTFVMPEGSGLNFGRRFNREYLLFEIHYKKPMPGLDNSGFMLEFTQDKLPRIFTNDRFMHYGGTIPALKTVKADMLCVWHHDQPIYPYHYLGHTHKFGVIVAGYVVNEKNEWTLIGKVDPRLPQVEHRVSDYPTIQIKKGDKLAIRCVYENPHSSPIDFGPHGEDNEMCNLGLGYVFDNEDQDAIPRWDMMKDCMLSRSKIDNWEDHLENIPEQEVNTINGVLYSIIGNLTKEKTEYFETA